MEKVLISALKQSVKTYLPKLSEATSFKEFINKDKSGQKFIANLPEDAGTHLKTKYLKGNNSIILIGPEGDFSSEEIANAIKKDYQSISLGRYRLRTETAGIIACHTINLLNDI
jgi:16S rRNA (uracil1498-N3)-methyltransferase